MAGPDLRRLLITYGRHSNKRYGGLAPNLIRGLPISNRKELACTGFKCGLFLAQTSSFAVLASLNGSGWEPILASSLRIACSRRPPCVCFRETKLAMSPCLNVPAARCPYCDATAAKCTCQFALHWPLRRRTPMGNGGRIRWYWFPRRAPWKSVVAAPQ